MKINYGDLRPIAIRFSDGRMAAVVASGTGVDVIFPDRRRVAVGECWPLAWEGDPEAEVLRREAVKVARGAASALQSEVESLRYFRFLSDDMKRRVMAASAGGLAAAAAENDRCQAEDQAARLAAEKLRTPARWDNYNQQGTDDSFPAWQAGRDGG